MALALYTSPHESSKLNTANPFRVTFDGRLGGSIQKKLYIRNDDVERWYESISLSVHDTEGDNIVDGSQEGFHWKLLEKDTTPALEEWRDISPGNTLSFSAELGSSASGGDVVTFLPCWVMVTIPRGQAISTITDIVLRISATEHAI